MLLWLGFAALATLAFANGANDNGKPIATILGAKMASPRRALVASTAATLLGSLLAIGLGKALAASFSAKGLVGVEVATTVPFVVSVLLGAALTVLLATRLGLPISTTHALIGAIVGAGLAATTVNAALLGSAFVIPLLSSPLVALAITALTGPGLTALAGRLGLSKGNCVCVKETWAPLSASADGTLATSVALPVLALEVSPVEGCRAHGGATLAGIEVQLATDALHWVSALSVSFGRGLQDGAKIAGLGLLLWGQHFALEGAIGVAVLMAAGGLLAARRVALTMSERIVSLSGGKALFANLVSAGLIFGATAAGLPVSTTHVTTGALVGVRLGSDAPRESWLGRILLSWVVTLPLAAGLAAVSAMWFCNTPPPAL